MSNDADNDAPATNDESREHDASKGGHPPINSPADEPDAESPKQIDEGDAGRRESTSDA
jgi:hypothetical protein